VARNPMFQLDERMVRLVFEYCRTRLALDPVPLDFGGIEASLDHALDGLMTDAGNDPDTVLRAYTEHLAPGVVSCDSPRFLSFIPAAPTKAALLFDMVVSCSSLQATSWLEAAGAVAAENQALRVLADLAGLPPRAGGCFVSGGTIANLSALVVARDTARLREAGTGLGRPPTTRPVRMAVTREAHSSVARAFAILGVDPFVVPSEDHRLTGSALARALAADTDPGRVVAVVTTAGTTNAGLVDDLAGVADVCEERGLWMHVDAAYGGAALFSTEARGLFDGVERADSLVIDPHKWLFAPFDCAALLYREPRLAKAVHTQDASYLDVIHDEVAEPWNPSDYAVHLTRRARGLPLWFSLAVHGTDAYRDAVDAVLQTAHACADLVRRAAHVELVRDPQLSIVLLRRPGWTRKDYDRWSAKLLSDQTAFVTPTTWEGEPVARLAFLHPDTTLSMVEEILASMA
jgi:aromatic-L-amino-acid/L-tryptophan decarboxylase